MRRLNPTGVGVADDRAQLGRRPAAGSGPPRRPRPHRRRAAQPRRPAPPAARAPRPHVRPADARAPPGGVRGNPLFAIELGRALLRTGEDAAPGRPLPVPETLRDLISDRLDTVSVHGPPGAAGGRRRAEPDARDGRGDASTSTRSARRRPPAWSRSATVGWCRPTRWWRRPATRRHPPPNAAPCTRRSPSWPATSRSGPATSPCRRRRVTTTWPRRCTNAATQAAERGANDSAVDLARLAVDHTADGRRAAVGPAAAARRSPVPHRRQRGTAVATLERVRTARSTGSPRPGPCACSPGSRGRRARPRREPTWCARASRCSGPDDPPALLAELHTTMAGVLLQRPPGQRRAQRGGARAALEHGRPRPAAARRRDGARRPRPTSSSAGGSTRIATCGRGPARAADRGAAARRGRAGLPRGRPASTPIGSTRPARSCWRCSSGRRPRTRARCRTRSATCRSSRCGRGTGRRPKRGPAATSSWPSGWGRPRSCARRTSTSRCSRRTGGRRGGRELAEELLAEAEPDGDIWSEASASGPARPGVRDRRRRSRCGQHLGRWNDLYLEIGLLEPGRRRLMGDYLEALVAVRGGGRGRGAPRRVRGAVAHSSTGRPDSARRRACGPSSGRSRATSTAPSTAVSEGIGRLRAGRPAVRPGPAASRRGRAPPPHPPEEGGPDGARRRPRAPSCELGAATLRGPGGRRARPDRPGIGRHAST